jgi:hypothetical protein
MVDVQGGNNGHDTATTLREATATTLDKAVTTLQSAAETTFDKAVAAPVAAGDEGAGAN